MEIRRFGVGNRRPDGPAGSSGVSGQVIHSDARGTIAELAFARRASIEPHSNPNTTWLVVIEGGGFVRAGDEQARVSAGEAVLWPAGVIHAAWTDLSEMRALVVELAGHDDGDAGRILDYRRLVLAAGEEAPAASPATPPARADGELASATPNGEHAAAEGEPL